LERKTSSSIGKKIALSEDGDSIKWTKVDVATKELVKKHQKNMASKSAMDGIVMNMQLRMQIDPNVADNEQRKILSSLFRVLDADTDGFVTRDELNAGNESLQNQKVVAKILEIFDKLDSEGGFQESDGKIKPGDGKLSMEEWHAGLEAAIQDVGWEGDYSIETLCNILTPENMAATLRAKADAAFDKIDANKDGKLTCKEMTEWCKKNPDAAKSLFGLGYCLQPSGFGLTNKQYEDMFGVKQGKGWSAGKEEFIKKYMEFLADSWPGCLDEQTEAADGEAEPAAAADKAAEEEAPPDKAPKTKEEFAAIMQALFTDIDANGNGVLDRPELSKDNFKMMFRTMESLICEYVSVPAEYADLEEEMGEAIDDQMSYITGGKFDLEAFTKYMSTIASKYGVISAEE